MKSRKTRKFNGGNLIGKGTYGCGFFPGFRCNDVSTRDKTVLTKLMLKDFAEDELEKAKKIRTVDPQMKYSNYPYKSCKPNMTNINTYMDEGFKECFFLDTKFNNPESVKYYINNGDLVFLQSKYGGKSLNTIMVEEYNQLIPSLPRIYNIYKNFNNILKGIEYYQKQNFIHFDIKDDNIVCDKSVCRMIDFGLSQNLKDYIPGNYEYDQTFPFTLDRLYIIWPLDSYFIKNWKSLFRNGKPYLADKYVDNYYKFLKSIPSIPPEMYMGEELDGSFIPFNSMDDIYLFYENLLNYMLVFNKGDLKTPSKQLREFIFKQLEVYTVGMQIAIMTYNITKKCMEYDEIKPIKEINSQHILKVPDEIVHDLYRLSIQMMNLNPFKRLTISEAVKKYELILQKMGFKKSIKRQTRKN